MQNDDMKVVTVMTRKGGAGKTTLMQAITSAAVKDGKRCLVLDADPQQALYRWFHRQEINNPLAKVQQLEFSTDLEEVIDAAWQAGETDIVFVDTQGAAGAWADDLAASSDFLVVPMKLAEKDLSITKDTFNWYVGLRDRTDDPAALPSLRIIFADVPTKPTIAQKAIEEEALRLFPIMENYFMHRNQHLDADSGGFLHDLANQRRESRYALLRTHARYFDEAVEEAHDILKEILGVE
ncbi:MAG: AAA family ATPase [Pseudomonadota bacterium]